MFSQTKHTQRIRRGAAAAEFALILPLLIVLFLAAVDFTRVFWCSLILAECARNGAVYGSDPDGPLGGSESPYSSIQQAALADVSGFQPAPTVSSQTGTDADGPYVAVTVSYQFTTLIHYPGVPGSPVNIGSTVRMRIQPTTPN